MLCKKLEVYFFPQQTAYIKNRFIGEAGRLKSDIMEIYLRKNIEGLLVTIDFEKVF